MKKFKIELTRTERFFIDVLSETQDEAEKIALEHFSDIVAGGTEHYYQDDEAETEATGAFDVTETDDPFSPINE